MLLGSTIVVFLPDQYEASSRVYVDTDSLMGPLLKGIAVEDDPTAAACDNAKYPS